MIQKTAQLADLPTNWAVKVQVNDLISFYKTYYIIIMLVVIKQISKV